LSCELDTDSWEASLRHLEARLAAWEWQLAERQMQELAVARKGMEDLQAPHAGEAQLVWRFLGQVDAALASFSFSPVRTGDTALEAGAMLLLLDLAETNISQLEEVVGSPLEEEGRALVQAVAEHVRMCFRSHDPSISLEAVVQGPIGEPPEAARVDVEDVAHVVAELFEREPKDA
jgi:hypothetical protein